MAVTFRSPTVPTRRPKVQADQDIAMTKAFGLVLGQMVRVANSQVRLEVDNALRTQLVQSQSQCEEKGIEMRHGLMVRVANSRVRLEVDDALRTQLPQSQSWCEEKGIEMR
ncbi:hypothetical protein Nepgr_031895 [Nepenthes gracilis]|uniref:Uncharacterized protein n=1 Tax=Nepenthes gracilis TaxID=150966 RepID=A0AAD3TIE7_NEPGR|nr:hypothetical protein Nepgr_031895 [Nepenthes gracilis]